MVIPFPAYRPTSWELQLPNYRVITNNWRATEWPEILGALPEDARLRLRYENITDQQALELLLLWRATAGGYYPLNPLPAEVAAGINDAALANRIRSIAPLSWVVADPPRQESIKNLRSGLDIELKSELRFAPSIALPTVACPVYAARQYAGCAPSSPTPPAGSNVIFEGELDPFGFNQVCLTYCAATVYERNPVTAEIGAAIRLQTTPGPNAPPKDCYNLAFGPFSIALIGSFGGVEPESLTVFILDQSGNALPGVDSPGTLGTLAFQTEVFRPPAFLSFTVTPVAGDPNFYVSAQTLTASELPPSGNPYAYPGIFAVNVNA